MNYARALGGQFALAIALADAVTKRLEVEQHVAQAERMEAVGRLAAGVAHDFNNMLTFILGRTQVLLGRAETWPVRTELANRPVASGTAALASSIVLVCRPRRIDAAMATRSEFLNALRAELDSIRGQQSTSKLARGKVFEQLKTVQEGIQKKVRSMF